MSDNMSAKINIDELKAMIANEIKEIGLHSVLGNDAIEKVKDKVVKTYNHEKAKNDVPELIPEAIAPIPGETPSSGLNQTTPETTIDSTVNTDSTNLISNKNIDSGTNGNIPAYTPELPEFMNNIEPGKVIVFSQNELSEGGENLSNKPLRTYENPDLRKSMHDLWMENGKRKADVYIAKLEKIGTLEFNYANGTTQFVENRFEPDFEAQAKYKENPYMADNAGPAKPGALDINGQPNIMAQGISSIDMERVVGDIVKNILQNYFLTNKTRAVNSVLEVSPDEYNGFNTSQAVKPMEESFNIKMIDLINDYNKIDTPNRLKEAIEKNDRSLLIKENEEVQEWEIEGNSYFLPVNKISTRKCYIKN